jgi:hypothetical protein
MNDIGQYENSKLFKLTSSINNLAIFSKRFNVIAPYGFCFKLGYVL